MNLGFERVKFIIAVILYGTIGMFLRYVSLPSEIVALSRGLLGSIFIFLYLRIRKERIDTKAIKNNISWLIVSGIFLGLNWIFLFAAYIHKII